MATVDSTLTAPPARAAPLRLAHHAGILTAANAAAVAAGLVQGILIARWLGPHAYGVSALVIAYPTVLFTFLDARSVDASVRYLTQFATRGESRRALAVCKLGYAVDLAIALLTFLLVAVSATWAERRVLHTEGIAALIVLYAAAFLPRALVGTSRAILLSLGRFRALASIEGLTAVGRASLAVWLVLAGYGVSGVVWASAAGLAVHGLALAMAADPAVRRAWGASWVSARWAVLAGHRREIVRFVFYNDLSALLGLVVKQGDLLLLGWLRGPVDAGFYRLAKSLGTLAGNLVAPLQSVLYPRLTALWSGGRREEARLALRHGAVRVGAPLGLALVAALPLLPDAIAAVAGPSYRPAAFAAQALMGASAVWLAFFWVRPLYLAAGAVRTWTAGMALYAAAFALLAVPVIDRWGLNGAALLLAAVNVGFHLLMVVNRPALSGRRR